MKDKKQKTTSEKNPNPEDDSIKNSSSTEAEKSDSVNKKSNLNEEKKEVRKTWISEGGREKIIIGVITGLITILLGSGALWGVQNKFRKDDLINSKKLEIVEKLSYSFSRYAYLANFKFSLSIMQAVYTEDKYTFSGENALYQQVQWDIQDSLREKYPFQYSKAMESEDYYPELSTNFILAKKLFGEAVNNKIDEFLDVANPQSAAFELIQNHVEKSEKDISAKDISEKEKSKMLKIYIAYREKIFSEMLTEMMNEIE